MTHPIRSVRDRCPGAQLRQTVAPTVELYMPDGQDVHTADVAPPVTWEYFPATQDTHSSCLVEALTAEYCPIPHCMHEYAGPDVNHSARNPTPVREPDVNMTCKKG